MSTTPVASLSNHTEIQKDKPKAPIKHTLQIGKNYRLIDMNGASKNFEIQFLVSANQNPEAEFEALVVSQAQLDDMNLQDLPLKKTKGRISGKLRSDKDIHQNYFLCLRSLETDIVVDVFLDCKDVEPDLEAIARSPAQQQPQQLSPLGQEEVVTPPCRPRWYSRYVPRWASKVPWAKVLAGVILLGVVLYIFAYRPYVRRQKASVTKDITVPSPPQKRRLLQAEEQKVTSSSSSEDTASEYSSEASEPVPYSKS